MKGLPVSIDPCPIIEAIFEMRFESSYPRDAIFGIIYKQFKDEFHKVIQLPVLQLPPAVREQDPNLRFTPHYKITADNFTIQIGPNVFSLINTTKYCGWKLFFEKIKETYRRLSELEVMEKRNRTALRYINVFENLNIFDESTFEINLQGRKIGGNRMNVLTEMPYDSGTSDLKVVNFAEVRVEGKILRGSIIDIDTKVMVDRYADFSDAINRAHQAEKALFFSLLKEDFLQTLKPVYQEV